MGYHARDLASSLAQKTGTSTPARAAPVQAIAPRTQRVLPAEPPPQQPPASWNTKVKLKASAAKVAEATARARTQQAPIRYKIDGFTAPQSTQNPPPIYASGKAALPAGERGTSAEEGGTSGAATLGALSPETTASAPAASSTTSSVEVPATDLAPSMPATVGNAPKSDDSMPATVGSTPKGDAAKSKWMWKGAKTPTSTKPPSAS